MKHTVCAGTAKLLHWKPNGRQSIIELKYRDAMLTLMEVGAPHTNSVCNQSEACSAGESRPEVMGAGGASGKAYNFSSLCSLGKQRPVIAVLSRVFQIIPLFISR